MSNKHPYGYTDTSSSSMHIPKSKTLRWLWRFAFLLTLLVTAISYKIAVDHSLVFEQQMIHLFRVLLVNLGSPVLMTFVAYKVTSLRYTSFPVVVYCVVSALVLVYQLLSMSYS